MRSAALVLALALAACGSGSDPAPTATATISIDLPASIDLGTTSPSPSPAARDYTPPTLTPEAEKTEKGARNLLLAWASAMEDREFDAAYALFGEYAVRAEPNASDYTAAFSGYRTITVSLGDGEVEGAAGSLYYEVPVTLTGVAQDGSDYRTDGTIVLRRVNDVDGATPAQLKWHLERFPW